MNNFCSSKHIINRVQKQVMDWKKNICNTHIQANDLFPEYTKNSYKWIKKGTHSIEKWTKDLKRQLIKDKAAMSIFVQIFPSI